MVRLLPILILTGAVVWALVECIQTDESEIRNLPKPFWILVILFFWGIGALAWFVVGRPKRQRRSRVPRRHGAAGGFPSYDQPRILAPEDDPEFLRKLKQSNAEHEQMLKRWEEDLRRREQEMRDGGDEPPSEDR